MLGVPYAVSAAVSPDPPEAMSKRGKKEKLKSLTVSWNQNGRWFDMRGAFGFWNIWEHFSYKSATLIAKMLHWQKQLWSLQDMTRLGPSFVCKERFWMFFFLIQWGVIEEPVSVLTSYLLELFRLAGGFLWSYQDNIFQHHSETGCF